MVHPKNQSEIHYVNQGKDVIRKKIPKNVDSTLADNKHLADIPYNLSNQPLQEQDVLNIYKKLGLDIKVNDLKLYQLACIHRSYLRETLQLAEADPEGGTEDLSAEQEMAFAIPLLEKEQYIKPGQDVSKLMPLQERSSERLEYLGDAVCGLSVASYLYSRYPEEDEGFMTRLRTRIVCGSKLGELAEKIGLTDFVVMSRYVESCNHGRTNYKVLEDVFEAFIGACFLDNYKNFAVCDKLIVRILETHIDFVSTISSNDNYKDTLLQFFQATFDGAFPKYTELLVENIKGVKYYTMGVLSADGSQVIGVSKHSRKRAAEQGASREALFALGASGFEHET